MLAIHDHRPGDFEVVGRFLKRQAVRAKGWPAAAERVAPERLLEVAPEDAPRTRTLTFNGTTFDHRRMLARYVAMHVLAPCEPCAPDWERDRREFWFFLLTFTDEALACMSPPRCPEKGHWIDLSLDELVAAFAEIRESAGKRVIGERCLNQDRIDAYQAKLRREGRS